MWRKRQLCKRYLWKCNPRLWCKISYCNLISAELLKCYSDCDTKQRTNKNFKGRTKTENFNLDRLQTDQSINILFQGLATKHNMLFYGWMRFYPVTKVDFQIMKPKAKNRVWMNIAKSLCVKIYFKRTWNHIHRVIFSMMRWIPIVFASHWVLQLETRKSLMGIFGLSVILLFILYFRFWRNSCWCQCKIVFGRKFRRTLNRLSIEFAESNL